MYRSFIRKHTTSVAILLFIVFFYIIQCCAPSFLYKKDGSIRPFGLGYKGKTVLPIWLIAIIVSISILLVCSLLFSNAKIIILISHSVKTWFLLICLHFFFLVL